MESPIRTKSFEFARRVVFFSEELKEARHYELARQIIRSGTSIGANVREAQNGFSKKDFKHKMHIALKEAGETEYWIDLLRETGQSIPQHLTEDCKELIRMLTAIVKNTKLN